MSDFPILRDKLNLWREQITQGNAEWRDYHRRAVAELAALLALSAPPIGSGRNLADATPNPDLPSEARADGRGTYVFLDLGDVIETGDECPSDDCSRWEPVNRWAIGSKRSSIFKIIRRSALTAPDSSASQTGDA